MQHLNTPNIFILLTTTKLFISHPNPPNMSTQNQEIDLESKRITISVDEVTDQIIEALIGVKGKSKSSVIYQIIRDWIDDNTEKIQSNWGINFAAIRMQILSRYRKEVKEVSPEEANLILRIIELFHTVKSINAEELAEELNIDIKKLRNIIFNNRIEFENKGLKLLYEDGKFFPE
jgi:transcription initiation factor IIE alpha subunit